MSNVLFLLISVILWGLTNNEGYLVGASLGIWTVLLAIIAVECAQQHQANPGANAQRKLFFLTVPTLYYPLAILTLFSLFAGVKLSYCLGVAVGYAYGFNKMDKLKVSVDRARKWESQDGSGGFLRGFVGRMGWVSVGMASGPAAWSEGGGGGSGGGSSLPFQMFGPRGGRGRDEEGASPSDQAETATPSTPSFPSSGGRSLGGGGGSSSSSSGGILSRGKKASTPKTPEERAALLERAAERRRQQQQQNGSEEGENAV